MRWLHRSPVRASQLAVGKGCFPLARPMADIRYSIRNRQEAARGVLDIVVACHSRDTKRQIFIVRISASRPQNPFFRLPRMPRTSARPTDEPTERTTDLIAASATLCRLDARGRGAERDRELRDGA